MSNHDNRGASLGEIKKRRLSKEHVRELEKGYEQENNPDEKRKEKIASDLGLNQKQVAVWFQNRRSRGKAKQIKRELEIAKAEIDILEVEKDLLEAKNDLFKCKMMKLERSQRALINRERAAAWSLGFTAGMEQAAAMAAASVAAPAYPHHLLQANMLNSSHGVGGYQAPEQTTFRAWPDQQHGFR